MKKRTFLIILVILLPFGLVPQEEAEDINWYAEEAEAAVEKENYEYAVKTLTKGIKLFPESAELNEQLADLYFSKELYQLALSQYLAADEKSPDDFYIMDRIQTSYGYLNREEESVRYLERMLELFPMEDNPESYYTVHDLGWMYFKTYRLESGEALLLDHIARRSEEDSKRSLLMSLATIYSGKYEYEKSREYYLLSIAEALEAEDSLFAAIAYYNLSLLEFTFYNFNSAMQYTEKSLEQYDRATGHLVRGELLQLQMNFADALAEYEKGLQTEETPLTTINMAVLFTRFGMLDSARQYAESAFTSRDLSWLMNFGTDKDRHKMEMHEIMADIYRGLHRREGLIPQANILGDIRSFFLSLWYWLNEYYHRQIYKTFSINVGKSYLREHNLLDAYWSFYKANEAYSSTSLKYLHQAREYETAVAPRALAYYLQAEGKIRKSPDLLQKSLDQFDPFWEKESLFESLVLLIPLSPRSSAERRDLLNRAYAINRGGVFAAGYGLPLQTELHLYGENRKLEKRIPAFLKKAGSQIVAADQKQTAAGYRYKLEIQWAEANVPQFTLSDTQTGEVLLDAVIDPGEGSLQDRCVKFMRMLLLDYIYVPGGI